MTHRPMTIHAESFWQQLNSPSMRKALLASLLGLLALATLLWLMPRMLPSEQVLTQFGLDGLPQNRLLAFGVFIVSGCVLTMIGLPRQNLSMFAGYFFGVGLGILAALLAVTLASVVLYEMGRGLAGPWVLRRFPAQVQRISQWANERTFARVLALRLFPIGSNLVMSLAGGVARARRVSFFSASFLGFVPQTAVFALAGEGVSTSDPYLFSFAFALLIVSIIIGVVFGMNKGS